MLETDFRLALAQVLMRADTAINSTPTGPERELLTDLVLLVKVLETLVDEDSRA